MIIDTHAHVYHPKLAPDLPEVIERARAAGVTRVLMPAIDAPSIAQALEICDAHEGYWAMAAIHPSDTKEATVADWETVVTACDDKRVIAVGETGLDYYWDRSFDEIQHRFLRRHIRLAREKDLPIVLHLRDKPKRVEVHRDMLRILEEEHFNAMRGIFHCFTGPAWVAEEAMALGFYLGIGGVITFKNGGLDKIAKDLPIVRMVLETDAPFIAPSPYRGKRNEPAYVRLVAERLAEVKGLALEEVARVTSENAETLFGI